MKPSRKSKAREREIRRPDFDHAEELRSERRAAKTAADFSEIANSFAIAHPDERISGGPTLQEFAQAHCAGQKDRSTHSLVSTR